MADKEYVKVCEFNKVLLDTIPFGMDIVDEEGNILYVSKKLKALFGARTSGKKCWELYKDNKEQCGPCPLKSGIQVGQTKTIEVDEVFGGKILQVSHTGMVYQGKKAILEVFEDITRRKHAEEKIVRLSKLKDEFVSTVSHELRIPLAITKEGINLILDRIVGDVNEKQEKLLITAKENIDRLVKIIDDLLNVAKIEAGRFELRKAKVDIRDVAKRVSTFFEPKLERKGLKLKLALPDKKLMAFVDGDRIVQVFTNLLGNAVKFTKEGAITIAAKEKKGLIECSVADSGTGIPRKDISKIFDRFEQAGRGQATVKKGTGLGLSISKALVDMHGGKIWAESEVGKGTKFIFTLPKNLKKAAR